MFFISFLLCVILNFFFSNLFHNFLKFTWFLKVKDGSSYKMEFMMWVWKLQWKFDKVIFYFFRFCIWELFQYFFQFPLQLHEYTFVSLLLYFKCCDTKFVILFWVWQQCIFKKVLIFAFKSYMILKLYMKLLIFIFFCYISWKLIYFFSYYYYF